MCVACYYLFLKVNMCQDHQFILHQVQAELREQSGN